MDTSASRSPYRIVANVYIYIQEAKVAFEAGTQENPDALGHSSNYSLWLGLILKIAQDVLHWGVDRDYWSNRGSSGHDREMVFTEDHLDRADDLSCEIAYYFDTLAAALELVVATTPPPNGSEQDLADYSKSRGVASVVKPVIESAFEVAESEEGFDLETLTELWKFLSDIMATAMGPATLGVLASE